MNTASYQSGLQYLRAQLQKYAGLDTREQANFVAQRATILILGKKESDTASRARYFVI